MNLGLSFRFGLGISIIGGSLSLLFPQLGWPLLGIGGLTLVWVARVWMAFRRLRSLVGKRLRVMFQGANFDAIGGSSPYIDFYLTVHSYMSREVSLTGKIHGDLWNPYIEAWHGSWSASLLNEDVIVPEADTTLRIRWYVPQGTMNEFAFRALDNPPEQAVTFEDMSVEAQASIDRFEQSVGYFSLWPGDVSTIQVPDHIAFRAVRTAYEKAREED